MARSRFNGQIARLNEELTIMDALCVRAIDKQAFAERALPS